MKRSRRYPRRYGSRFPLVFEEGQLPDNTTVSIEQYTNNYILHFTTHSISGDDEIQIMNNLSDVLIDGGFIEVE